MEEDSHAEARRRNESECNAEQQQAKPSLSTIAPTIFLKIDW
jgi:hypothetical protein